MINDILVILMVAFGLFAVCMFVLFYVLLKKNYNNKHMSDDYKKYLDDEDLIEEKKINDEEYIPKKKVI